MKTHFNKIISTILVAVMLLSALPFTASAEELSGTCGDNLTWTLNAETGELIISGTGDMYDYKSWDNFVPWQENRSSIKTVTISDGVISIGDYAFYDCDGLIGVTIGNSVTTIGYSVFNDCDSLTSITIPDGVITIGDSALYNCDSLTSVTIGDSVTTVGASAFYDCDSLTGVTIGDSVTTIGDYAFYNCNRITNVTIPNSVTTIGDYAFYYCTGLMSLTIPDSVTTIGEGAFSACDSLTDVTIPVSVVSEGSNVFYAENARFIITKGNGTVPDYDESSYFNVPWRGCQEVIIEDGVTGIGDYMFFATNLTSVTIPDSVTSIGDSAFDACYDITTAYYTGTIEQWLKIDIGENNSRLIDNVILYADSERPCYAPSKCGENLTYVLYTDGELVISGTGDMYNYPYNISPPQFPWEKEDVVSVTIEYGVTGIGQGAFQYCSNITSITIPDSVTTIGDHAFDCCTSLTSITMGNGVKEIGNGAFQYCSNITSITIPDSVTTIGDSALCYCTSLTNVTIGNGVKEIGNGAFGYCSSLTGVTIPNEVESVGDSAFSGCNLLTEITIPASVTAIGNAAFANCSDLEEVVFDGDDPMNLGDNLFSNSPKAMICCEENSWLHFYASSNGLKFCLFDGDGVPAFEIKNNVLISYRGQSENACVSLVNQIGYGAFESNATIKNVEIAKSVNIIYNNAFKNCTELKSVIIPQSVASIGATAFDGCDNLTIWCYAGSYADEYAQSHNIAVEYITLKMEKDVVYLSPNGTMTMTYSFNMPLAENVSVVWESTDKSVVTVDAFGNIKGVKAGTAVVVATSKDGSMRDYCVVKVVGIEALSTVTIDYDNGFITGIESNTTSLDGLIAMTDSTCSLSYTTLGTDSVVYVQRENEIVDAYTVLIFGDVNGDGWYDGTDSIIVSCLANGLLTQDSVSEAVYRAADCNHDGVIDSFDVAILEQAGLLLSNVDQSKSNEELATDEAFIEYLDLIDQTPEDETVEDEAPETPEPPETEPETEEFDFIQFIITIIKKFFELLLSSLPI